MFLEQAYPRPMWFFPTTFAVQSVVLSFGGANAVGKYWILHPLYSVYFCELRSLISSD